VISFDLKCRTQDHVFEGWFGSAESYRDQMERGLIACPQCGSADIEKQLSIPNVGAKSNQQSQVKAEAAPLTTAPTPAMSRPTTLPTALPPAVREVIARVAEAQAEALRQSEWVGGAFAENVRAQHYGETEAKLVHGEATAEQAEELAEEGIAIMPILFPIAPPDKRN
jgi:hypothetical protein